MSELLRVLPGRGLRESHTDPHLTQEWLVTNGLGGYASGTVLGPLTRRYHGLLIAALPNPLGRIMMLNALSERIRLPNRTVFFAGPRELTGHGSESTISASEFRLEAGLPVWRFEAAGFVLEKRVLLPYRQNTVYITYKLLEGSGAVRLGLRPGVNMRSHDAPVSAPLSQNFVLRVIEHGYEICSEANLPTMRLLCEPAAAFTFDRKTIPHILFRTEQNRGYESEGAMWSPGYFRIDLEPGAEATFMASSESWETLHALTATDAHNAEMTRRRALLAASQPEVRKGIPAELVMAADQFLITPAGRVEDVARAHAAGDEVRTVIAGYHWFTDWGRDTMISLEGLTLTTGRYGEAGWILRTFAHYVKDGLIPNMFPEGEKNGLYHTADASLWFFHAISRYVEMTGDRTTLALILPKLLEIAMTHIEGTRFGIHVDPEDGLLHQGEQGYQLTWMDAKVADWVVTPRRGKAVEINALWYNALRLLTGWMEETYGAESAKVYKDHAAQARDSFNRRFWYEEGGYLYDAIDGEDGKDDPACRPNQIFAISLGNPVLDESRWKRVVDVVTERLLTPVGLRSLAPDDKDYKSKYFGDLHARDAAYHQGTVWAWLIGPYVDAWLKVHPNERERAVQFLSGFPPHLDEACIGSISEVFDAEEPHTPRGCIAQAWSVAEVLRCYALTA
ncbi:MAG: putative glycogen debranching enzyme [Bryobacterales bacterium]|nr:putative glycogen debranching enzyme [Bryobacterales bacterium]